MKFPSAQLQFAQNRLVPKKPNHNFNYVFGWRFASTANQKLSILAFRFDCFISMILCSLISGRWVSAVMAIAPAGGKCRLPWW